MRNLFIDFETYYSSEDGYDLKHMSMVEYLRDPRFKVHGCAYAFDDLPTHWLGPDGAFNLIRDIDWARTWVIAHNVKFDGAIVAWHYKANPAVYFDTVSMARAVIGQNLGSHSLKAVAQYLGLRPKGELKIDGVKQLSYAQETELSEYCKNDVEICREIFYKLSPAFPESQVSALDWTIRAFVEPKLALDGETLKKVVQDEKARRAEAIAKAGVTKDILSSNARFAELLLSQGVRVPSKASPRTPGKTIPAFALGDAEFLALKEKAPLLYEARVAAKSTIIETRGTKLEKIAQGGLFPFDIQFSGAVATHRYSGGGGAGGNPQNFPKKGDMRKAVRAPAGHKLVVADFSAIEARIIAWLAKDPILVRAFELNEDIYSAFASTIYGRPINKHDNPEERKFGKEGILGLGYGMGPEKFQKRVKLVLGKDISLDEARRVVGLYRDTYTIPQLWGNLSGLIPLMASGQEGIIPCAPFMRYGKQKLILPSGLEMQYPNLRKIFTEGRPEWVYDVYKKKASEPVKLYGGKLSENICQALAGEITKAAISRATDSGLSIVGQVHDEIICVSMADQAAANKRVLQSCMESPYAWWPEFKAAAEVGIGDNWKEAKA